MTSEWKRLDKRVRKALLTGERAPDEHTAGVAVREARARLERGWRARLVRGLPIGVALGLVTAALMLADARGAAFAPVAVCLVAVVALLCAVAGAVPRFASVPVTESSV